MAGDETMTQSSHLDTVGYAELLLRNHDFRNLYVGRLISLFGGWFNLLALLALLREIGGHSASSFGAILILKTLPMLIFSPQAGALADRVNRLRILWVADLVQAFIVFGMLSMMWVPSVWLLYGLVIAQSAAASFFEPARGALLPEIVSKRELTAANALGAVSWSAMLTFGAALGGLFTALVGWEWALVVDACTFLVSMGFVLRIKKGGTPAETERGGSRDLSGLRSFREVFGYLKKRPQVATLVMVKGAWSLAASTTLLLTLMGERVFPVGSSTVFSVTLFYVFRGVGTGVGPIVSRVLAKEDPARMERLIASSFALGAVFYAALAFAPVLPLALLCVLIAHIGGATAWVFSTVRLQQMVPNSIRGRVFAAENALFTVMIAVSTGAQGVLFDFEWVHPRQMAMLIGLSLLCVSVASRIRGAVLGWGEADTP
jgi:MFS family permease